MVTASTITVALVGISGCAGGNDADDQVELLPQGLRQELESLRDPWGLYVDPTYYDAAGFFYTTAMLDGASEGGSAADIDVSAAAKTLCSGDEQELVEEPWFTWSVTQVLGDTQAPCLSDEQPATTGDASHDIPQFYAWAAAQSVRGASVETLRAAADPILEHARASEIDSPYVMWRWDQIERVLELPSTATERPALPPAAMSEPGNLTEWWGYESRCAESEMTCSAKSPPSDESIAQAAVAFGDELSLAGALSMLRLRESDSFVEVLQETVETRRAGETGLVRPSAFVGRIETSYNVLLLDWEMFPGPSPELTSTELQRRLDQLPAEETLTRMQAIALLRAVDTEASHRYDAEVTAAFETLDGTTVTKDNLEHLVDVATALSMLGDSPTLRLKLFDVTDDQTSYLARKAIASWTAFENGEEIVERYSDVRDEALDTAMNPTDPVATYVAGLESLTGPGLDLTQEQYEEISAAARELQGCRLGDSHSEFFYRFELRPSSACSLSNLVDISRAGFGVYP